LPILKKWVWRVEAKHFFVKKCSKSTRQTHFFKMSQDSFILFWTFWTSFWTYLIFKLKFEDWSEKKRSFETLIFGFGRGSQVGKSSFLEVNLRHKRRSWAYHFHLVCFRPREPTETLEFGRRRSIFSQCEKNSETTTLRKAGRCCVKR